MQNTTNPDDEQNLDSEHFPNSVAKSNTDRPQKFSFSTTYSASHFNSANNKYYHLPTNAQQLNSSSAFTVVNEDISFPSKPNAIVRPFPRPPLAQVLSRPGAANDSNAFDVEPLYLEQHPQQQQLQQHQQASGSSVTHQQGIGGQDARSFMDELNRKLRFLNDKENTGTTWTKTKFYTSPYADISSHRSSTHGKRPLFITTVPTGIFLPPPKELPPLPPSYRRSVYAFSSHPVILNTDYSHCNHSYHNTKNNYTTNDSNSNSNSNSNYKRSTFSKDKAITSADKQPYNTSNNSSRVNAISGIQGFSSTVALAGVVHLTKQQFQQQIRQHRAKRETPVEPYKNVMYDRRVVRGSNFGPTAFLEDSDPFDKAAELRRKNALRKRNCRNPRNVLGTPPPVAGRRHEVIQTEKYLEELVARPPEFSVDTQTDLFLERPPTPPYIPAKVGIDVGTEIGEGELFHFDAEAQPIIDILVDACIEQSMLEVAHQQEIEALRSKQEKFLAQREAELAELRRLEAEEIRLQAEKERRLRQDSIAKQLDEEMQKGVTAAKLLQGHIAGLLPEVLENLEPATDAAKKEHLMKTITPWLSAQVAEEVGQIVDSREILTVIIQEIIKQRAEVYAGYKEDVPKLDVQEPFVCEYEEEGACDIAPECCVCETESSDECLPKP